MIIRGAATLDVTREIAAPLRREGQELHSWETA